MGNLSRGLFHGQTYCCCCVGVCHGDPMTLYTTLVYQGGILCTGMFLDQTCFIHIIDALTLCLKWKCTISLIDAYL